ncbi:MAG: RHS repeat-associated core domain-containing protein [Lacunisphaera sp.]
MARFDYTHDERYQRATAAQSGSAFADYYAGTGYSHVFNNYTYNARGELQTAAMYRGDTPSPTPSSGDELPGRRFEYRFDSLGNRTTAGETGSPGAADDEYTANALNQYTSKENNTVRVLGTAASSAHVAVLGAAATGKLDRAWGADLVPANGSAAAGGTATAYAAIVGGGSGGADLIKSLSQPFFIPKALQAFTYDDDGNLTQDGVWDYQYDAENRLVAMQNRSEAIGAGMIAGADARRLEFKYDYKNRRVRKTVHGGWNGSTYATTLSDTKFLYDGANLIAEFDALSTLTLTRSFTWGLDLQGSLTASGGVGALLQIRDETQNKTLLPTYDGNGNVAALLNADTGALEAAYEYDPFGNLLRKEGVYAADNPFRFSTKWQDDETGLIYYGERYYSSALGRFINRDPIEEAGGVNLYGFVGNNAVNSVDVLGMGDDDDVWVLDKMTVTGSNSNGGGGGIFIHYSGRGVRPPPVKHMPDSPTLPPGLSYQGGFPEFFGISDVDPLSELVGSDALTTQLGFEVTDSSGVNLDALRDTVPQVTDSFSSDGYASAMKTNPATVMRMLAPAPNGTPRTRAPNNTVDAFIGNGSAATITGVTRNWNYADVRSTILANGSQEGKDFISALEGSGRYIYGFTSILQTRTLNGDLVWKDTGTNVQTAWSGPGLTGDPRGSGFSMPSRRRDLVVA